MPFLPFPSSMETAARHSHLHSLLTKKMVEGVHSLQICLGFFSIFTFGKFPSLYSWTWFWFEIMAVILLWYGTELGCGPRLSRETVYKNDHQWIGLDVSILIPN